METDTPATATAGGEDAMAVDEVDLTGSDDDDVVAVAVAAAVDVTPNDGNNNNNNNPTTSLETSKEANECEEKTAASSTTEKATGAITTTSTTTSRNNNSTPMKTYSSPTKTPANTPANTNNTTTTKKQQSNKLIHLAGFADASPSPINNKGGGVPSFWAVGSGVGATSAVSAAGGEGGDINTTNNNTGTKKVQVAWGEPAKFGTGMKPPPTSASYGGMKDPHNVPPSASATFPTNSTDSEISATPAAQALMDAISANAVATATLTSDNDEEDIIQELMRENTTGTSEHNGAGGADAIETAARAAAATLNREALYTTYETNYATVQNDRDELRKRLNVKDVEAARQSEENKRLKLELANVKREMEGVDESKEEMRGLVSGEKSKHNDTLRQLECERERVDRGERESDALRKEISRLTTSNAEYNTLLNSMTTQHSKSSSEALPLRLQVKRLEQELEAVQGHANYLDGELASRNESIGSLKLAHSNELRTIKGELTQTQISLGQLERELTASRMTSAQTSKEVERLQTKLYNVQMDYTSQKELFEQDLNSERELVGLKEQRMLLAEDARASLMREVEELKSHAKVAAEEATKMEDEMQSRFNEGIEEAVLDVREEEQQKRDMLEERLQIAEDAKLRLEDDILNRPTPRKRRIEGGGAQQQQPLAIIDGNNSLVMLEGSDDPLSLTDLYTRLASTEDELHTAQHENQKLRVVISRIQRDVAAKTPLYHQKQVELENALEELEVAQERLDYARREVTDIRADNQDLELRYKQVERECGEWKRENKDLAMQVQSLLQRRSGGDMVTFEDISSLQSQNQMLLRDHHSMTDKIAELEDKMKNNDDANELSNLRTEVGSLREEREKQTNLVAGIVHQRDLYRALVAKNDAPLLQGENQLAIADAKAEQLPMIEAKNADLTEEVSKLRAEVSTTKHENEALVGRLARVDTHANELTTSNELLRGEMTAAKATAARLEIDVSHYQGKCERLENSLEMIKAESASESKRKAQLEDLLNKTHNHLDTVRGELAKKEQRYQQVSVSPLNVYSWRRLHAGCQSNKCIRISSQIPIQASSKMRLLEVQLETSTSNEKRMESEALSLRSEIARQETLLTSVQRIEASLTAKSESELETLQEELKRLQESKSDDNKKQSEAVQKLEGKIADLELSVKELTTQKEEATVTATKANLEVSKSKVNISELTLKLKSTEKELTAAKVKLGDVTIDTSAEEVLEAKVATLTTELDSTKSDLETAQKRIADYQAIAKLAEEQVTELTAASTKYKDETTVTLEKLRKSEQSQREAVTELTNDLMNHRAEKDKAVNELKAKSDSLTSQLAGAKDDASKAIANMESLADEAKRYQLDSKNSNGNYERELALHADARTALRDARSSMETEQRLRETAESQLAMTTAEIETERGAWEVSKTKLEKSLSEAKKRFDDMRSQNNLLHDQMTALSSTVDKFQSEKTSQLVGGGSSGDKADKGTSDEKQLSDLRELLKFKQSECTMLEADLASAKRASERERTAAELAKRSLQEARSELKVLRESGDLAASGSTEKEMDDLHAKLKTAEEQLVLLRESNTMLREESQKVTKKLSEVQSQLTSLKSSTAPATEKMKAMEVERAALVAEKDSLSREVDAWKNRVHSLVSKFNQIDPEEHEQALATVEKLKKECSTLKTQKEAADGNSTKAKNIVTRLNKEISSQKASMEAFKTALEKTKKEKELLTKSAKAAQITSKKITEAQVGSVVTKYGTCTCTRCLLTTTNFIYFLT